MATYDLKPQLNRLNGVATVVVQGGQEPEFHITPDPAKLLATSVTVTDILDAVRRTNLIDSPGLLAAEPSALSRTGECPGDDPGANRPNRRQKYTPPVCPSASAMLPPCGRGEARVHHRHRQRKAGHSAEHQPPAGQQHGGRWPMRCTPRLRACSRRCRRASSWSPSTISLRSSPNPSRACATRYSSDSFLASLIMVLFLRDWGTSLVAGLVIPVTVLVTFIVLKVLNQSFNLMTLGGLAAAVGLVIDDAIVVVENIALHRDAGQGRLEAIQQRTAERSRFRWSVRPSRPIVVFFR